MKAQGEPLQAAKDGIAHPAQPVQANADGKEVLGRRKGALPEMQEQGHQGESGQQSAFVLCGQDVRPPSGQGLAAKHGIDNQGERPWLEEVGPDACNKECGHRHNTWSIFPKKAEGPEEPIHRGRMLAGRAGEIEPGMGLLQLGPGSWLGSGSPHSV